MTHPVTKAPSEDEVIAELGPLIARVRALVSRPALMTDDIRELARIGAAICPRAEALATLLRERNEQIERVDAALIEHGQTCSGNAGPSAIFCFVCDGRAPNTIEFKHDEGCPVGAAAAREKARGKSGLPS